MARSSFAFHNGEPDAALLSILHIGWSVVEDKGYHWNGMKRSDHGVLFQYTLSGCGQLRVGETQYSVPAQTGFFVTIPSDHVYYYEADMDEPWEFLWLQMAGEDVYTMFNRVIALFGPLLVLPRESRPIRLLHELYGLVEKKKLSDRYEQTIYLYEWMISLLKLGKTGSKVSEEGTEPWVKAKHFMERYFSQPIGLPEIAQSAGLSKNYFCTKFQEQAGVTPIYYLQKRRIEEGVRLLKQSNKSIQEITELIGFESSSYFGKVFQKFIGVSPGEYRSSRDPRMTDSIFLNG
jgi:AraC-like DNA-binding protein